jgi:hypothetical protein
MDRARAGEVLAALGEQVGEGVLLWRGDQLTGSDIDVVALPGSEERLERSLAGAGLEHRDPGEWRAPDADVMVDVMHASDWPPEYPPLDGVAERSSAPSPGSPRVASAEDRLLVYAAEAVRGRDVAKLAHKARALLADPAVSERLRALAAAEGCTPLAELIADPDSLEARAQRGVLPYRRALGVALRCRGARAALARRARASAVRRLAGR